MTLKQRTSQVGKEPLTTNEAKGKQETALQSGAKSQIKKHFYTSPVKKQGCTTRSLQTAKTQH